MSNHWKTGMAEKCTEHGVVLRTNCGFARDGRMWSRMRDGEDLSDIPEACGHSSDDFGEFCHDVSAPMREAT